MNEAKELELEELYDKWFYKFATEEPDGTYTLVIHEVHDGDAYSEFEKLVKAYISDNYVRRDGLANLEVKRSDDVKSRKGKP